MYIVHVLEQICILSVKLLLAKTDGAASKKSNEIHLKLDNCQLKEFLLIPRVSLQNDLSLGYPPEFFRALFLIILLAHCGGGHQGERGDQG